MVRLDTAIAPSIPSGSASLCRIWTAAAATVRPIVIRKPEEAYVSFCWAMSPEECQNGEILFNRQSVEERILIVSFEKKKKVN